MCDQGADPAEYHLDRGLDDAAIPGAIIRPA